LCSALSAARTDISPNTAGLRLGVATMLVHTRLETVITKLSQCALAGKARGTPEYNHKAWSELCKSRRDVRMQIAFRFSNRPLIFPTTAKPDAWDPVELQNIPRRRGRPPKSATLQQEDESLETNSQVTKRARQSTLSFVTPGDRMDE
jgi:hypothetical protein